MKKDAIFSDGTISFRNPAEPKPGDRVTIRVRTYKEDSLKVFLCTESSRIMMSEDIIRGAFKYYSSTIGLGDKEFRYYFEIQSKDETVYYDRKGVCEWQRQEYSFAIKPGFFVPDWAKGAVMYQILVDRFANGDTSNDVEDNEYFYINIPSRKIVDWDEPPKDFDVANFYGGDLAGVAKKLGYLKSLGIEAIYFNPLFVSPSNHKYDAQDYDSIDPHIGKIVEDGGECLKISDTDNRNATKYIKRVTNRANLEASNKMFADFVELAHNANIKVIIDGVFNHCGSFNKWLDREGIYKDSPDYKIGAFWEKESPYTEFFSFEETGKWPKNTEYDGWWGHDTLPKLNYENSDALCEYILNIGKKWVSPPYNADGWRLDVAADLGHSEEYNHRFWKRFRNAVKEANPNAIILAEHYGDAASWLRGDEWDTIMNYDAFMEPVSYFLTGMEKHSDSFEEEAIGDGERFENVMKQEMIQFMTPSVMCSMNQLSNHDHSRFLTRTNHKVGRVSDLGSDAAGEDVELAVFRQGVLMQMTWPGAPTVYYGDEAGVVGFTDPDNRRTYPWGKENQQLIDFYRDCIYLRKLNSSLKTGSLIFIESGKNYVCYGRFNAEEKIIVVINTSKEDLEIELPVWKAEIPDSCKLTRLMVTNCSGYSILPSQKDVLSGYLRTTLSPQSGEVYKWG